MSDAIDDRGSTGKCPVDLETRSLWGLWKGGAGDIGGDEQQRTRRPGVVEAEQKKKTASLEEAARHAQTPHPRQRLPLSTHRLESTIPRSGGTANADRRDGGDGVDLPAHQIRVDDDDEAANGNGNANSNWVYPSEQQVFNAMKRKGWTNVEEESIPSFLRIHNSVNERSWKEVLRWEGCDDENENGENGNGDEIELGRFEGRPKDLTPKAFLLSSLGIRDRPFDRHDWYVVRSSNRGGEEGAAATTTSTEEKRYVLDFYMTGGGDDDERSGTGMMMPRVEIDVRPALDSPEAVFQRGKGILRDLFPGIAREYDGFVRRKSSQSQSQSSSSSTPPR